MKIRKATKEDVSRILELFNSDPNLRGDDRLEYKERHIVEFVEGPTSRTFVYETEGKIIGVITTEFWNIAKYVLFNDIIVDKGYRKKGIGFELQSCVEKLAKEQGMKLLFLFSEEDNEKVHKMLEKGGFKKGKKFYFFSKELE